MRKGERETRMSNCRGIRKQEQIGWGRNVVEFRYFPPIDRDYYDYYYYYHRDGRAEIYNKIIRARLV